MLKNDYVVTALIGLGVFVLFVAMCGLFVFGFHRETYDQEEEQIAKEVKERAELRAKSFECE